MSKTALVLAGGGSRGSYELGVWQALRELDIELHIAVSYTHLDVYKRQLIQSLVCCIIFVAQIIFLRRKICLSCWLFQIRQSIPL